MLGKLFLMLVLFLLVFSFGMYMQYKVNLVTDNSKFKFHGPVLEDENLSHFSETSERIKLEYGS